MKGKIKIIILTLPRSKVIGNGIYLPDLMYIINLTYMQGFLELNLTEIPKHHTLKKNKVKNAKYQGTFKDGELEGDVNVIVNDNIMYRSRFNSGIELPVSK